MRWSADCNECIKHLCTGPLFCAIKITKALVFNKTMPQPTLCKTGLTGYQVIEKLCTINPTDPDPRLLSQIVPQACLSDLTELILSLPRRKAEVAWHSTPKFLRSTTILPCKVGRINHSPTFNLACRYTFYTLNLVKRQCSTEKTSTELVEFGHF